VAKRSFIEEASPHLPRQRPIPWPLGGSRKVLVRILSDAEREQAYFAAKDHFKALKKTIDHKDPAFENRERTELVFRAFRAIDEDGTETDEHVAASADELSKYSDRIIDALYIAWHEYQLESGAKPVDRETVKGLVEELKKNIPAEALAGLPSSWLIAVITTLVDQLSSSPTPSSSG
jgi:hypothetical protein